MEVIVIAAMAMNRVIGHRQTIPWHIPAELRYFRTVTWGHPLIMGRRTFDSIGRPLPGRRNIVVSRNSSLVLPGCEMAASLEAALARCSGSDRVFVIGGEQLFRQAIPMADTIMLSTIARQVEGDTYFPLFGEEFEQISLESFAEPEPYQIEIYRRTAG